MRSMLELSMGACLAFAVAACGDDSGAREDEGDAAADGLDAARSDGAPSDVDAADAPSADCAEDVPTFAEVELLSKCLGCHSTERTGDARSGATAGVNFDDYDSARAAAERAALYVFHGIMPPPAVGIAVSEDEKRQLYQWALCGTPE